MKVLVQRVSRAAVTAGTDVIAEIGSGLLLLVGFGNSDGCSKLKSMASKVVQLRIFPDETGKFHYSVLDTGGEVLAVPQFTLYGETRKGRRPDFSSALAPDAARVLFSQFVIEIADAGVQWVSAGRFAEHMEVSSVNDGPVTLMLDA
ncbi:MAG: D-aminoacyl-tRNA deacylase [Gammaproteobacteria bacterium]|nr:D-aminoacyl-tRNA deacylase [Gammaproteobacteria bacterium]